MKTASLEQRKAARRIDRKGPLADLPRNTVAQVVERRALDATSSSTTRTVPLSGHIVLVCTTLRDRPLCRASPSRQYMPSCCSARSPKGTSSDRRTRRSPTTLKQHGKRSHSLPTCVLDGERNLARDLIRAGIRRADNVVVLSGKATPSSRLLPWTLR